jgi:hypothetical protein
MEFRTIAEAAKTNMARPSPVKDASTGGEPHERASVLASYVNL